MKLVITEHYDYYIGYMDFVESTKILYDYMEEIYTFWCSLSKPFYVFFKDEILALSAKNVIMASNLELPRFIDMPQEYLCVWLDSTKKDFDLEVIKIRMNIEALDKLLQAISSYNEILKKLPVRNIQV